MLKTSFLSLFFTLIIFFLFSTSSHTIFAAGTCAGAPQYKDYTAHCDKTTGRCSLPFTWVNSGGTSHSLNNDTSWCSSTAQCGICISKYDTNGSCVTNADGACKKGQFQSRIRSSGNCGGPSDHGCNVSTGVCFYTNDTKEIRSAVCSICNPRSDNEQPYCGYNDKCGGGFPDSCGGTINCGGCYNNYHCAQSGGGNGHCECDNEPTWECGKNSCGGGPGNTCGPNQQCDNHQCVTHYSCNDNTGSCVADKQGGSVNLTNCKNNCNQRACNGTIVCSGGCNVECGNGKRTNCKYTTYNGSGACKPVNAPDQDCSPNCQSPKNCVNHQCVNPAPPDCNTGVSCSGACNVACGPGTKGGCTFTTYNNGGGACNRVGAPNQGCNGTTTCTYPASCSGGTCKSPNCNAGVSCGACSVSCGPPSGAQACTYTTYSGGGACIPIAAPSQACTPGCTGGKICSSGTCVTPTCNATISCTGACNVQCGNGTKSNCSYTTYTGGVACTPAGAPPQACGPTCSGATPDCVGNVCTCNARAAPSSVSPNGTLYDSQTQNITWPAVGGAVTYLVQVDDLANGWNWVPMNPGDVYQENASTSFPYAFQAGHSYNIWIYSKSACGAYSAGTYSYVHVVGWVWGHVWVDNNNDTSEVSPDAGLPGVNVTLSGAANGSFSTDSSGNFVFWDIPVGAYTVTVPQTGGYVTPLTQLSSRIPPSDSSLRFRLIPTTYFNPKGNHDGSTCIVSSGWTCDADNFNQAIDVHFYRDGPAGGGGTFIGAVNANVSRPDVAGQCGGTGNHGFNFNTPVSLYDGTAHSIYAYAINIGNGNANPLLTSSPKAINCARPIYTISGTIWLDNDASNTINAGDSGYGGATVTAVGPVSNSGASAVGSGAYTIANNVDGTYSVTLLAGSLPAGWTIIGSASVAVNVVGSPVSNVNFLVRPPTYSITGGVFVDSNNNGRKDAGEAYADNSITPTRTITLSRAGFATQTFPSGVTGINATGIYAGTWRVTYTDPPPASSKYVVTYPTNGTVPPAVNVTLGVPPACVDGGGDSSCTPGGSIVNMNFGIYLVPPPAWFQTVGGDLRKDSLITNAISDGATCTSGVTTQAAASAAKTSAPTIDPGIVFSAQSSADLGATGAQNTKASTKGWLALNNKFNPARGSVRTSYAYLNDVMTKGGLTIYSMFPGGNNGAPPCGGAKPNCTFPVGNANFPAHVYTTDTGLTIQGGPSTYDFAAGTNYIFLINGNLRIERNMTVPIGSTVIFAVSGSITIGANVTTVEGIYSAGNNFVIEAGGGTLNINGSVIANANLSGGTMVNSRDLGGGATGNGFCPAVKFSFRPDFVLNLPATVKVPNYIIQEVAPGPKFTP